MVLVDYIGIFYKLQDFCHHTVHVHIPGSLWQYFT